MDRTFFKVTKFLDEGTSHPVVNRLSLQLFKMIDTNHFNLTKEQRDAFMQVMLDCMKGLLTSEKLLGEIVEIHNDFINRLSLDDGVVVTQNSIHFDDPTDRLYEVFESFIVKLIIALRKIIKLPSTIYEVEIDGPKNLNKVLYDLFGVDSDIYKMVKGDAQWFRELYDLRGNFEHGTVKMSRFDVISTTESIEYNLPKIEMNDKLVVELAIGYYNAAFTFCEDFAVYLLDQRVDSIAKVYSISQSRRNNEADFRYEVGLSPEYRKKFNKAIKKGQQ